VAGIGYFHFFKAFRQSMGVSPNQYLLERRVERAKALLARTELSIADIALRVGFSRQSHFATTFRRLAGTTPRVYRATA
jgi:AraC family transcriptional regulator